MIEIICWYETSVSSAAQAEERYERILEDASPVPVRDLDGPLRAFVSRLREEAPDARVLELGRAGGERLYSRHGVAVTIPDELAKPLYGIVSDLAIGQNLSIYDREDGYVIGLEHDPDIVIDE
ncbi:hypothetical protein GCM10009853_029810 [Glycomyces scopariae]|uniref:Uncharacterized protein n=1 Tax=Glycomyces sambucus TaxID=380244 RepID=A0A1G9FY04_9ACTN|nr:hypothetical protein [Glycomyces sambucus]SDK93306.1 hypothetical protein SAMN05216298_2102 [Glycomyces sambucus]